MIFSRSSNHFAPHLTLDGPLTRSTPWAACTQLRAQLIGWTMTVCKWACKTSLPNCGNFQYLIIIGGLKLNGSKSNWLRVQVTKTKSCFFQLRNFKFSSLWRKRSENNKKPPLGRDARKWSKFTKNPREKKDPYNFKKKPWKTEQFVTFGSVFLRSHMIQNSGELHNFLCNCFQHHPRTWTDSGANSLWNAKNLTSALMTRSALIICCSSSLLHFKWLHFHTS